MCTAILFILASIEIINGFYSTSLSVCSIADSHWCVLNNAQLFQQVDGAITAKTIQHERPK